MKSNHIGSGGNFKPGLGLNPVFASPEICSRNEDEMQKIYEAEMPFLETCLKLNPKSYGSWHHRGWVSSRLPRPDWGKELSLCNLCLSLDDRNCK